MLVIFSYMEVSFSSLPVSYITIKQKYCTVVSHSVCHPFDILGLSVGCGTYDMLKCFHVKGFHRCIIHTYKQDSDT